MGNSGIQIIGLVIAAVIGFWVASDAKKRGMSFWWGVGTFLVCIIFLPLYLIVRKPLLTAGGNSAGNAGLHAAAGPIPAAAARAISASSSSAVPGAAGWNRASANGRSGAFLHAVRPEVRGDREVLPQLWRAGTIALEMETAKSPTALRRFLDQRAA